MIDIHTISTPWRQPQWTSWLLFRHLDQPRKHPRVPAAVRAVVEGVWARGRTPAFTNEIVARSLDNRDLFYRMALQNPTPTMQQSVTNAHLLTRLARGDPHLKVKIPRRKPRRYKRYLADHGLIRPWSGRGAFDKLHYPRFVSFEAQHVRDLAIRQMRASLLVALAQDLDRVLAPQQVRAQEQVALARKIIAIPVASAAAVAAIALPIPGSAAYAGYQTYRVIAGGSGKDVFEEGQWWRETRTDSTFRKEYRRLTRRIKPVLMEAAPGEKPSTRKLLYHRGEIWDIMRVIYFSQPKQDFIRANMAVEYYNTLLLKALQYVRQHPLPVSSS